MKLPFHLSMALVSLSLLLAFATSASLSTSTTKPHKRFHKYLWFAIPIIILVIGLCIFGFCCQVSKPATPSKAKSKSLTRRNSKSPKSPVSFWSKSPGNLSTAAHSMGRPIGADSRTHSSSMNTLLVGASSNTSSYETSITSVAAASKLGSPASWCKGTSFVASAFENPVASKGPLSGTLSGFKIFKTDTGLYQSKIGPRSTGHRFGDGTSKIG